MVCEGNLGGFRGTPPPPIQPVTLRVRRLGLELRRQRVMMPGSLRPAPTVGTPPASARSSFPLAGRFTSCLVSGTVLVAAVGSVKQSNGHAAATPKKRLMNTSGNTNSVNSCLQEALFTAHLYHPQDGATPTILTLDTRPRAATL
jgi:hypothetical protein